jgi:hypothetical protein
MNEARSRGLTAGMIQPDQISTVSETKILRKIEFCLGNRAKQNEPEQTNHGYEERQQLP